MVDEHVGHRPDHTVDRNARRANVSTALILARRRRLLAELRPGLHQRVPRGDQPTRLCLDISIGHRPALPVRLDGLADGVVRRQFVRTGRNGVRQNLDIVLPEVLAAVDQLACKLLSLVSE